MTPTGEQDLKKQTPWTIPQLSHLIPPALSLLSVTTHLLNDKSESESRSVVSDSLRPIDYTVHEILQARILEWVAFPFSRGSS